MEAAAILKAVENLVDSRISLPSEARIFPLNEIRLQGSASAGPPQERARA